jgi:hypothetical protein
MREPPGEMRDGYGSPQVKTVLPMGMENNLAAVVSSPPLS